MFLRKLYPDGYIDSVYNVDYGKLYSDGYRIVMYDIDNTLVMHDEGATDRLKDLFKHIHSENLLIALISNNNYERVHSFYEESGADFFKYSSHKPSPVAYEDTITSADIPRENAIFFGDQLFTDVWGARNADIFSVLVKPIGREKLLRIKLKRILEKPILFFYNRYMRRYEGYRVPMV